LILSESALSDASRLGDLLDELTMLDASGFYVVILRESDSDPLWSDQMRAVRHRNLLYLVHVLSLNGMEVHVGYTDISGFLLLAAGASSIGTSWFKSARQMCCVGMGESTGGQQARSVYASGPLLSWILLAPDLQTIASASLMGLILTPMADGRAPQSPLAGQWNREREVLEYWRTMSYLDARIMGGSTEAQLASARSLLSAADAVTSRLRAAGVSLERPPRHLAAWTDTVDALVQELGTPA